MYIDKAGSEDVGELKKLWLSAFDDEENIVDLFMSKVRPRSLTYVVREADQIASVLYAIPTLDNNYYLYALATQDCFRGRGYMSALIRYFVREAQVADYFFLIPAEEGLKPYYEGLGFDICVPAEFDLQTGRDIFDGGVKEYVMGELEAEDGAWPDLGCALVHRIGGRTPENIRGVIPF